MATPVPRASLPDHVFAQLREALISGAYSPGERLPPQRALASEFGVNMASVREALKRLEQLRFVDVRHGDATRVLDWRHSGGLEVLVPGARMDAELVRDLFEARRLLLAIQRRPRGSALLARTGTLGQAVHALLALGRYDDERVARTLGYDASAVVARGRELRRGAGRP
jgi:DNA-binding GntR family transcriptional regulator